MGLQKYCEAERCIGKAAMIAIFPIEEPGLRIFNDEDSPPNNKACACLCAFYQGQPLYDGLGSRLFWQM